MAAPVAVFPLIPGVNADDYENLVVASAGSEGLVNGIWNAILNCRFPPQFLRFTINPEVRSAGGFPDLLVKNNHFESSPIHSPWIVIFEGKSSETRDTRDNIRRQLNDYADSVLADNQDIFLIAATGRECCFWHYRKGHPVPDFRMSSDGDGIVHDDPDVGFSSYDIVSQQGSISDMLLYIMQNLPT